MIARIIGAIWPTEDSHFVCIYGCGFWGTYAAVQAHQAVCPNNSRR